MFTTDPTVFLSELAADDTTGFFLAHRDRSSAGCTGRCGRWPPHWSRSSGRCGCSGRTRNRRFTPDAPPYRVDTGGTARGEMLAVVLSATALTVSAGTWRFDPGQLRRYRAAVDDGLAALLTGHDLVPTPRRTGRPRGVPADHPQLDLLRLRGVQVGRS